ncbi:MAG: PAS domain S-box protein [Limisphaerales bacterium]
MKEIGDLTLALDEHAMVVVTDPAGKITYVNDRFCAVSKYSSDELLGKDPRVVNSGYHPKQFMRGLWKTIQKGKVWKGDIRNKAKDGLFFWTDTTVVPFLNGNGTRRYISIGTDITRRKRAEEARSQLAAIVNSSDDAIIGKSLDGVITSWNHGAERIFGYPAAEAIGQSMLMLIPPDRKDEEAKILASIARGKMVESFETVRVRKDGKAINISATISPIIDEQGRVIGASKIARDITKNKQLEEQLRQAQKMEAIGLLAGGVAHDFNNVLAVIQMQADLMRDERSFHPHNEFIDEISAAAARATALTRQLLLFSRKETMHFQDLELNDSVGNMTRMLRRTIGENIQMRFKFSPQPLFVHADAGMIDQVLMNLAVNSRDAMLRGGELIIETSAVDFDETASSQSAKVRPGSFACLSVGDTGCGISAENLPRIFEPFFTTKDVGRGTGLGLATVFGIVEQHHGWVNVYSEVGRGTTFRIYLPRLARAPETKSELGSLTSLPSGTETILLVEDDFHVRATVRRALTRLGYVVLEATNGAEGLEVWRQNQKTIRLVLTDMVMPGGMSGRDLGVQLLQKNPGLKVIYASGYSAEVAEKDFLLEEGVDFLTKPYPIAKLAQTIRARLDG